MTYSILDDILGLEDKTIRGMKAYFDEVGVITFQDLYSLPNADKIILYILCAYSEESPMLICGQDPTEESNQICEKLYIPEFMHEQLCILQEPYFKSCVVEYLNNFAGAEFKELQFLKITLKGIKEILAGMLCVKTVKEKDEVDTTEFDAATHSRLINSSEVISKKIAKMESELKKRREYKNIERFLGKTAKESKDRSFNIESNELIKRK